MTILAWIGAAVVVFCGGLAFMGILVWLFGNGDKPVSRQPVAPVPVPDKPEPTTPLFRCNHWTITCPANCSKGKPQPYMADTIKCGVWRLTAHRMQVPEWEKNAI